MSEKSRDEALQEIKNVLEEYSKDRRDRATADTEVKRKLKAILDRIPFVPLLAQGHHINDKGLEQGHVNAIQHGMNRIALEDAQHHKDSDLGREKLNLFFLSYVKCSTPEQQEKVEGEFVEYMEGYITYLQANGIKLLS